MPQPAEVDTVADELIRVYTQAQEALDARWAAIVDDPTRWRERRRLREMRAATDRELRVVDAAMRVWVAERLPFVYELGGRAAATVGEPFDWALPHREAVQSLATDTFDDLLAATEHVRDDVKARVRVLSKAKVESVVTEGKTAVQGGRDLRRALEPLRSITYRDGSVHSMREYAQVVARTKSAVAYNTGTVTQGARFGVQWWEVFDGGGCGWESHHGGDEANGSIRSLEEVTAHPISHPNCRRSFGPRPDLGSQTEAEQASPTPETNVGPERPAVPVPSPVGSTSGRSARTPRAGRQPRSGR